MAKIVKVRVDQAWPQQWPQDIVGHLLPIIAARPRIRDIQAFACTCRQFWAWSSGWHTSISLANGFLRNPQSNLRITVRMSALPEDRKRLLACAAMRKAPAPPAHLMALSVVKDIADQSGEDEDFVHILSAWRADDCLAMATFVAFPGRLGADAQAVQLITRTLEELTPGPALDKLALMLIGALGKMRVAYKLVDMALMQNMKRLSPSSQVEVLAAVCSGRILRESVGMLMGVVRERLLDRTLLSHPGADACLYWVYTNVRQLLNADAPLWLNEDVIGCLRLRICKLHRPREWTADSGWVLQLLNAARRLYRDDEDELQRVFSTVGAALEAGGWCYMTSNEFTSYCEALQSDEMTGHFNWVQENQVRLDDNCVLS